MQATARRPFVVSATSCARRRLIRAVLPGTEHSPKAMKPPSFQQITRAERDWIDAQIRAGRDFVQKWASDHSTLDLAALDSAWSAWMATSAAAIDEINHAINSIGIPFGLILTQTGEWEWCIAADDWGTDLAVRALPERGDMVLYPANFVSKRWESRTCNFLERAFPQIMDQVDRLRREWDTSKPQS